jgi:hypothetical protein
MELIFGLMGAFILFVFALPFLLFFLGFTSISENQVGIVVKRFATHNLPPGRIVATEGEAGFQAETLAPGWRLGLWPWQYKVTKVPMVIIPQGQIALIVAADGATIPGERILAKVIDCDDFQDAKKFLENGGEQGRQLRILTAGTYRINTALFTVITQDNCGKHGMTPDQLRVFEVRADMVGIIAVRLVAQRLAVAVGVEAVRPAVPLVVDVVVAVALHAARHAVAVGVRAVDDRVAVVVPAVVARRLRRDRAAEQQKQQQRHRDPGREKASVARTWSDPPHRRLGVGRATTSASRTAAMRWSRSTGTGSVSPKRRVALPCSRGRSSSPSAASKASEAGSTDQCSVKPA